MNEPIEPVEQPDDSGSLADHEADFAPASSDAPAATPAADEEPGADGRDGQGRFRQRPESQKARPDDRETINALTKRYRDVEAEIAADIARQPGESPRIFEMRKRAEIAERLREAKKAPAPAVRAAVERQAPARQPAPAAAAATTKPNANDEAKYPGGVYDPQYMEDLADWKVDQKLEGRDAKERETQQRTAAEARHAKRAGAYTQRLAEARAEYPDFDAVALANTTEWEKGSLIDAFIWEHKGGLRVLRELMRDPAQRRAIMALSAYDPLTGEQDEHGTDQYDALTLLAQRLSPASSAASNGSAQPPARIVAAPRPPNPLRTGPTKPSDEPPGDDGSLEDHEKFYGRQARR